MRKIEHVALLEIYRAALLPRVERVRHLFIGVLGKPESSMPRREQAVESINVSV